MRLPNRRACSLLVASVLASAGPVFADETAVVVDDASLTASADRLSRSPLSILPSAPASGDAPLLKRLQRLEGGESRSREEKGSDLRLQMLRTEGMATGAQHALYWRTKSLQSQFHALRKYYDRVYNDSILTVLIRFRDYYIVPPVISATAGGMRKSDSGRVLRIAEATYRIERDPYLTVNPPTWRDYLLYKVEKPKAPHEALLPRSREEQAVWSEAVARGWGSGVKQADNIMRVRLARLTRDIVGMIRYHMLRMRNMVSEPVVDVRYTPVSGGGRMMSIEDSVIRITSNPSLNANRDSWRPLPELPDTRWLFPPDYLAYRGVTE